MTISNREPTILTGWWDFAVRALTALTTPADTDACDRGVEQLARESVVGNMLHRASTVVRQAWLTSWFRSVAMPLAAALTQSPASAPWMPWRVAGWMIAVTGATALGLNQLAPIPLGPLTWVVPSALVAVGLLVMAGAAPLSRAAADRDLRHRERG